MTLITRVMDLLDFGSENLSSTCNENSTDVPSARPYRRQLEHHKKRLEVGGKHDEFHRHMIIHCEHMIKTIEECEQKYQ